MEPKRAPGYLHYNRASTPMAWGVALLVLAQFSLGYAAFDAIRRSPGVSADGYAGTSGLDVALLIFGFLAASIGLLTLVIGVANMAGNVDLVAWATRERMRAAATAAGLDQPRL